MGGGGTNRALVGGEHFRHSGLDRFRDACSSEGDADLTSSVGERVDAAEVYTGGETLCLCGQLNERAVVRKGRVVDREGEMEDVLVEVSGPNSPFACNGRTRSSRTVLLRMASR